MSILRFSLPTDSPDPPRRGICIVDVGIIIGVHRCLFWQHRRRYGWFSFLPVVKKNVIHVLSKTIWKAYTTAWLSTKEISVRISCTDGDTTVVLPLREGIIISFPIMNGIAVHFIVVYLTNRDSSLEDVQVSFDSRHIKTARKIMIVFLSFNHPRIIPGMSFRIGAVILQPLYDL
jgi:hypothetical protein